MFPLPLPTQWRLANDHAKLMSQPTLKDWVCSESSLTVRIKELGVCFSVEVLNQTNVELTYADQQALSCTDTHGLVREVVLKQADIALIYAQTLMPASTVEGTERRLAELGNQSLGQVLFQSKHTKREAIECSEVPVDSVLGAFVSDFLGQAIKPPMFIRRSLFRLNDKPLLVNECFLPALTNEF